MFSYSLENADFFSKRVELVKRGFFFRKWKKTTFKPKNNQIISQKINQIGADDGILDQDYDDEFKEKQWLKSNQNNNNKTFDEDQLLIVNEEDENNNQFNNIQQEDSNQNNLNRLSQKNFNPNSKFNQDLLNSQNKDIQKQDEDEGQSKDANQQNTYIYQKNKNNQPKYLKYGDIIYLKYYVDQRKKGIVSGDGIASNKLELIPQEEEQTKQQKGFIQGIIEQIQDPNQIDEQMKQEQQSISGIYAKKNFRKCLFQIINNKKYVYQKKYSDFQHAYDPSKPEDVQNFENLQEKAEQEKNENERQLNRISGSSVIYGEEIQLKHLYSNSTLTLNPKALAKANCCREITLNEQDLEWSNFKIISANDTHKNGEPIQYSDYIGLVSANDSNQFLNVDEQGSKFHMGLEVNSFDAPDSFKLCNFLDYKEYRKRQQHEFKGQILDSGDIITLKNTVTQSYLGVKLTKYFEQNIIQRPVYFEQASKEKFLLNQPYYDALTSFEDVKNSNIFYLDKKIKVDDEISVGVLWEIQKAEAFDTTQPNFEHPFRIKNVATGLYMTIENEKLILSRNGQSDYSLFYLVAKKSIMETSEGISYLNRVQLQSFINNQQVLCLNEEEIHVQKQLIGQSHINEAISVYKEQIDKHENGRTFFLINSANSQLGHLADQISSMYPYLQKFYQILQEWGIVKQNNYFHYSSKQAFEDQKALSNGVQELHQSLENLSKFLNDKDESILLYRQQVILENGILSLLISILQLIHFHIYGNKETITTRLQSQWNKIYSSQQIPQKSAQRIALLKLKPSIAKLYEIITLSIKGNSQSSSFLLSNNNQEQVTNNQNINFIDFFIEQYKYHKQLVQALLKEAVCYTNSNQKDSQTDHVKKWVEKLDFVTEENIEEQSFIIELLSLTLTDALEKPLEIAQNQCKKHIFSVSNQQKLFQQDHKQNKVVKSLFENCLVKFRTQTKQVNKRNQNGEMVSQTELVPVVIFNCDESKLDIYQDWTQKNMEITNLYKHQKIRERFYRFATEDSPYLGSRTFELAFVNGYVEKEINPISGQGILFQYEQYILNCLQLYYYMGKNRNLKVIQQLKETVGLDEQFIRLVLQQSGNTHLRLFKHFSNLYESLILDLEPFQRISENQNKCYTAEQIQKFKHTEESYKLFREITFSQKKKDEIIKYLQKKEKIQDNSQFKQVNRQLFLDNDKQPNQSIFSKENLHSLIDKFKKNSMNDLELVEHYAHAMHALEQNEESSEFQSIFSKQLINEFNLPPPSKNKNKNDDDNFNQPKLQYPEKFNIEKLISDSQKQNVQIDIDLAVSFQLDAFLSMLKLIQTRIDLGYNNLKQNLQIYHNTANIFLGLIYYKYGKDVDQLKQTSFHKFKKNWIFYFIKKSCEYLYEKEQFSLLITKVFVTAVEIIDILQVLKQHIQVIIFIKNYLKNQSADAYSDMNSMQSSYQSFYRKNQKNMKSMLQVEEYNNSDSSDSDDQNNTDRENFNNFKKQLQIWRQNLDIFDEDLVLEVKSKAFNKKINMVTLMYKTLEVCEEKVQLKEQIQKNLIHTFDYMKTSYQLLQQIEVIEDSYELHLYKLVNGSNKLDTQKTDPKSIKDWQHMCQKAIYYIKEVRNKFLQQQEEESNGINNLNENQEKLLKQQQQQLALNQQSNNKVLQKVFGQKLPAISKFKTVIKTFTNLKQIKESTKRMFLQCKSCLETLISYFDMQDMATIEPPPLRTKEVYQTQLQNIIRTSGIYKYILELLTQDVYFDDTFLEFYRIIIHFLTLFIKNNETNIRLVLPYFSHILDLSMIPCKNSCQQIVEQKIQQKSPPHPLKVQNLCVELLAPLKQTEEVIPYIKMIFQKIWANQPFNKAYEEDIKQKTHKFFKQNFQENLLENVRSQLKNPYPNILKLQAIIQWMRVLKSLTFKENNCNIKQNQEKILNSMLKSKIIIDMIQPIRPEQISELRKKFDKKYEIQDYKHNPQCRKDLISRENEFWKIKLHVAALTLLTSAFKNYQQGIQEVQRLIMFQSLKNILCNQFSPFMIKRVYLRALFEAYINKVTDKDDPKLSTNTVMAEDIQNILSGEIITQLDTKNIYNYLEGLVRIPQHDIEKQADEQWAIRKQIIKVKIEYFQNNKEFTTLCQHDQQELKNETYKYKQYVGILKDPLEFWKYVMYQDGVMHFLSDTYDERIHDIESENQKDNILADEYSIIKTNMMKLRQLFDYLERDFRVQKQKLYLDDYRELMNSIEDIIPKRKIIKFGKNFRIGIDENKKVNVETYDTVAEDMIGQGFREIDDKNKQENKIKKYLRLFFMRNRMSPKKFKAMLVEEQQKGIQRIAKGFYNVINKDSQYLNAEEIKIWVHKDCGINQLYNQQNFNKNDESYYDFTDQNIEIIDNLIQAYFKKAKGPKEIINDENKENELKKRQLKIRQMQPPVTDLTQISLFFKKITFQMLKLDSYILQHQHYESIKKQGNQYEDQKKEYLKHIIKQGCSTLYKQKDLQTPIEDQRVIADSQILKVIQDYINNFEIYSNGDRQDRALYNFTEFIFKCNKIFREQTIYKIKTVRLFLEHIKLNNRDLQNLRDDDNPQVKQSAIKKKSIYKQYQDCIIDSEIYLSAINLLSEQQPFNIQYECLTLLNEMLYLGNENGQKKILLCLKENIDIQMQFFGYLRSYFLKNKQKEMYEIKKRRLKYKNRENEIENSEFEILTLKILEFIRLLCENVNTEFQQFFRQQTDKNKAGANHNIILEVTNLLTYFMEETILEIYQKQQLIIQCFETLIDLATGDIHNQKTICNNKRLFNFLNEKIIMARYNFKELEVEKNKFKSTVDPVHEKKLSLFVSAIKFLHIITNSNEDHESVQNILDQLDTYQLLINLKQIYEERIYPKGNRSKQQKIILEIKCNHIGEEWSSCNRRYCQRGDITQEDISLVEIGFTIFIFFSYLYDMFPQSDKLKHFRNLMEDNKQEFLEAQEDEDEEILAIQNHNQQIQKQDQKQNKIIQKNFEDKNQHQNKQQKFYFCCCCRKPERKKETPQQLIEKLSNNFKGRARKNKRLQEIKIRDQKLNGEFAGIDFEYLNSLEDIQNFTIRQDQLELQREYQNKIQRQESFSSKNSDVQLLQQSQQQIEIQDSKLVNLLKQQAQQIDQDKKYRAQLQNLSNHRSRKFFRFFKHFRGVTEVVYNDKVKKVYFKKPFVSHFLSGFIKKNLIEEANRESDQERIEYLRSNYQSYFQQMNWKQEISKYRPLPQLVNNWRELKHFCFYLVLLENITFLVTFDDIEEGDSSLQWVQNFNLVVCILQLIISSIVLIFCAIERKPISIQKGQLDDNVIRLLAIKSQAGFDDPLKMKYAKNRQIFVIIVNFLQKYTFLKLFLVMIDFEFIYNFIYLVFAIWAFFNQYIYAVLLLDIVKQSPDLQNIIKSITQNLQSIIKFGLLGIIMMTIYGIILYKNFGPGAKYGFGDEQDTSQGDCNSDLTTFCDDLIMTVTTCFNFGLTAGGGIADGLRVADYQTEGSNTHFWLRYLYDFTWFILIQMLFIQIIFGIIVDTFSELRDKRGTLIKDIQEKCFICGLNRAYIDEYSETGWYQHIYMEHNVYHMLFFMIYINQKNSTDCDALEKMVKKQLNAPNGSPLDFVPIRRSTKIKKGQMIKEDDE